MTTLRTPSTLITSVKTTLFTADVKQLIKSLFNITLGLASKSQQDKHNFATVLCVLRYIYFSVSQGEKNKRQAEIFTNRFIWLFQLISLDLKVKSNLENCKQPSLRTCTSAFERGTVIHLQNLPYLHTTILTIKR